MKSSQLLHEPINHTQKPHELAQCSKLLKNVGLQRQVVGSCKLISIVQQQLICNLTLVFTVPQKPTINLWVLISTGKLNFIINKKIEA